MSCNEFLRLGMPLMGHPEGKNLEIDAVSQISLNAMKFDVNS